MFCSKCGIENVENAMFCKNCGASLYVQQQAQAEKDFFKKSEEPQEQVKTEPTENPVIALIKKCSSSQLFLTATILLTIALGLSLFGGGTTLSISGILALIAVWKIRNAGKKQRIDMSVFSLLKAACVIGIIAGAVIFGLGGVVVLISGLFVSQFASSFEAEWEELMRVIEDAFEKAGASANFGIDIKEFLTADYISTLATTFGIIFIIGCVVTIAFNAISLKNIDAIKNMAKTGVVKKNVSHQFIVFLYVMGGLNAASVLSGDIATGVMGVALILYATVLSGFKNEAETLKEIVADNQSSEIN